MGVPLQNCREAILHLSGIKEIRVIKISSFYRTEPVGLENQDWFVNAAAEIRTVLTARNLLVAIQKIESAMGRKREIKGGPRIIDLDLLFYGQDIINEADLIVPHPEIQKRRFVLEPLNEIASYLIHPSFGVSIRGLKDRRDSDADDCKIVELIR
jgi:2-amino-4-hydroxy-6-hydroxymethyldihydropteridine diphosphokinase